MKEEACVVDRLHKEIICVVWELKNDQYQRLIVLYMMVIA